MKGPNQFYCLFVIALLFIIPATSFAQPANDECSNAVLLTSSSTCVNTGGTNVNGTYNPSTIPVIGCGALTNMMFGTVLWRKALHIL